MVRRAVAALALVLAAGCAREDISDFSFVRGLRVLGAQAEPPEAKPGDSVALHAWVFDTRGGDIDVSWSACLLPSNGLANNDCVPGGPGTIALAHGADAMVTVPAVTAQMLGPPDATEGVYLPILLRAQANGDVADAVYRLRISTTSAMPNQNPRFMDIERLPQGAPQPIHEGDVWPMVAKYVFPSAEEYHLASQQKDVFEKLTTQWFATAGTFPNEPVGGTAVQSLKLDRGLPAPGGLIDLWVVGHDDRGGTAMMHGQFVMR